MLITLTYASRIAPGSDQAMFARIVDHASAANLRLGITGAICLDAGKIVQILEGPCGPVCDLFGRIQEDNRHEGVVELGHVEIERRKFGQWGLSRRPATDLMMMSADYPLA